MNRNRRSLEFPKELRKAGLPFAAKLSDGHPERVTMGGSRTDMLRGHSLQMLTLLLRKPESRSLISFVTLVLLLSHSIPALFLLSSYVAQTSS